MPDFAIAPRADERRPALCRAANAITLRHPAGAATRRARGERAIAMDLPKTALGLFGWLVVVLAFEVEFSDRPLLFQLLGMIVLSTVCFGLLGGVVKLRKPRSRSRSLRQP
jgi:hypothetical protein